MNDAAIEQEIKSKGLTAPRVTPHDVDRAITAAIYFTADDAAHAPKAFIERFTDSPVQQSTSLLTLCVLVLENGFTVVGKSACASPENFDAALGRKIALNDAKAQMWPLLGYALKEKLAAA